MKNLSNRELIYINGGDGLWNNWMKTIEDAGQYVGGFFVGLFTGECPC